MEIQYSSKRQVEKIGSFQLEIECLDDLDRTIDDVFRQLEAIGNPQLLEELCPYFGVVWPAARGLAEYLAQLPHDAVSGKSLLELGCGLAIPSMVASMRGARVVATDFHPIVPQFLNSNIRLNKIINLEYQVVNWEKERPDLGQFDWVVGSDILYERRYPKSLAETIRSQMKPGATVIIADPGRPYLQNFSDAMKELGFELETHIYSVPHGNKNQEVFVLLFKLPA
jgi:predicted nicotinamide N-methyase